MSFLGWPYVEGISAWGELTGTTARFCEMDCYMTPWIVEFINTVTNLFYVYLGIRGYLYTRQNTKDSAILFAHALLIGVGFGSTAYHLNVKYLSQMADEIAMFLLTNTLLYCTFSISASPPLDGTKTFSSNELLKISVTMFTVLLSATHYKLGLKEPFELCFITLVIIIFSRCAYIMQRQVIRPDVRQHMKDLLLFASGLFAFAIAIQKLDFVFCAKLTRVRHKLGLPLGFITELHGWWHILTANAVYCFITIIEYLRALVNERDNKFEHTTLNGKTQESVAVGGEGKAKLIWRSVFELPSVEAIEGDGVKKTE